MRPIMLGWVGLVIVLIASPSWAEESPATPRPQEEHAWLERFVGEWETEAEIDMGPGQPPLKTKGTETARMLGGFWMIAEVKGDFSGQLYEAVLTLGYDPKKQKYIGTWIDSMSDYLWNYVGTVNEEGDTLTLETRGPCPDRPGELANIREVMEFTSADERVFTSSRRDENGEWKKMMTVRYRRK